MHSKDSLAVHTRHDDVCTTNHVVKKIGLLLPLLHTASILTPWRLERHGDEVRLSYYPLFMQKQTGLIWNVYPSAGVLNIHKQVPIFVQNAELIKHIPFNG